MTRIGDPGFFSFRTILAQYIDKNLCIIYCIVTSEDPIVVFGKISKRSQQFIENYNEREAQR
jgi:hypothetical protein